MEARALTPKGRATRERIIQTATELFAAEGYAAVSIRTIAERSGISSGAIYATFKGKADVLAEAVSASLASDLEIIEPDMFGRPLPEVVGRQFERLGDPGRRRLRLLLMNAAAAARTDPDVRERLEPLLRSRLQAWTAAYEAWGEAEGIDRDVDMSALVTSLIAMDLGLAVLDELGVGLPDAGRSALLVARMVQGLAD